MMKDIYGFEGIYQVDECGNVFSVVTGRMRVQSKHPSGYLTVTLYHKGKAYFKLVHRLVAEAFLPNPEEKREVNHIDGDKENNDLSNLEWVTTKENALHALAKKLMKSGERHVQSKLSDVDADYIRTFYKRADPLFGGLALADRFGVSPQLISAIVKRKARRWI